MAIAAAILFGALLRPASESGEDWNLRVRRTRLLCGWLRPAPESGEDWNHFLTSYLAFEFIVAPGLQIERTSCSTRKQLC